MLKENIFSSEMVGYKYPNTSWLSDVFLYLIFEKFGFFGITLLGGIVSAATLILFFEAGNLALWQRIFLIPLILYLEEPVLAASYRAQFLSFLLVGLMFFILKKSGKLIFFLPFVFLVWVNLHGEYLTGLALLFLWTLFQIKSKQLKLYVLVFLLSFAATFVNPFGLNIYFESLRHFGNPLQKYVVEWLPLEFLSKLWINHVVSGIILIFLVTFLYQKKKIKKYLPWVGLAVLFYPLAFWMIRYAWIFYFLLIIPIKPLLEEVKFKYINRVALGLLAVYGLFQIIPKLNFAQLSQMSWDSYCANYIGCSPKSAQVLVDNHLSQDLYTFYDWGGWLIWNYPQIKPSMDGRMALWEENGFSAFREYYSLEQNKIDIDKSKYKAVLISPRKPLFYRLLYLVQEGKWELIYQDQYAGVFRRKESKVNF